jgi:hypothetical protein
MQWQVRVEWVVGEALAVEVLVAVRALRRCGRPGLDSDVHNHDGR